jgi:hypothetical protein
VGQGQIQQEDRNSTSIKAGDLITLNLILIDDVLIDRPACFERPPARPDSYFRYEEFGGFCLPAKSLNRPKELHLPPELVGHDVSEVDW